MVEEFNVGIVGAGYVGLVTGACLAYVGHLVVCVDKDEGRIAGLEEGRMPFYEPGLGEFVAEGTRRGRLRFSTNLSRVAGWTDALFVAVDTPQGEDGAADLSGVVAVARGIGRALAEPGVRRERPLVVVNKSTVPVGTGDRVSALIREGGARGADYRVVSNPEFLREGSAIYDCLFPDRIVVGTGSKDALDTMRTLYRPIVEQSFPTDVEPRPKAAVPFIATDLASAEMIKYASNAFLAAKISFVNEIAGICELVGADIGSVARGVGLDGRIGSRYLNPGIGWGGSCLPKDVAALRSIAREHGHEPVLLDAAVAVNERQRDKVVAELRRELGDLGDKRVALLGLAFKPHTDDLREAPGPKIAHTLKSSGARVVGYDPVAGKKATRRFPGIEVVFDPNEALSGAHAAVLVTEWDEFGELDPRRVAALMEPPRLLVDGRNALDPVAATNAGLLYRGFGRR